MVKFILGVCLFFSFVNTGYLQENKIIDSVVYGKNKYSVFAIPKYKLDIYNKSGIKKETMLLIQAISNIECGNYYGYCFNGFDSGPLQINKIHKNEFRYSQELIKKKRYKTLFEFQLNWTIQRIIRFDKSLCKNKSGLDRVRCQAIHHNGNNKIVYGKRYKYIYAEKVILIFNKLKKYYELENL